jgi:hypothetical protein
VTPEKRGLHLTEFPGGRRNLNGVGMLRKWEGGRAVLRVGVPVVALLSCAGLLLAACSTTTPSDGAAIERAAEGTIESQPETTPEEPTTKLQESLTDQEGADLEPVQSVYRGARVCVVNARSLERRPLPRLNVIFTKADRISKEETLVAPGDEICGEAAYSTSWEDVTGEIFMMYEEQLPMKFKAHNAVVGASGEIGWNFASPCAHVSAEPETRVYDNGEVRFTLQRLNDSKEFKEFTITVAESQGADYNCPR